MDALPSALSALANFKQFIIYALVPSKTRAGKTDKIPVNHLTGGYADAHNPALWLDANTAIEMCKVYGQGYGVGFVFTNNDPFFFLDIDNCLQGNQWSPLAMSLMSAFNGAAIEISTSGKGLHIIGSGKVAQAHGCKNQELGIELYTEKRFVALTGRQAVGNAATEHSACLQWLIAHYFSQSAKQAGGDWRISWNNLIKAGKDSSWNGPTDDDALIQKMLQSKSVASAFNQNKASFKDLWENNVDMFLKCYPSEAGGYDESTVDAALAQHLAFWTGNDAERMKRLMLRSGLVRDKYDREDYLPRTIVTACGRQKDFLCERSHDVILNSPLKTSNYLTIEQQQEHFQGCVYVQESNRIMIPGGDLLDKERFKVIYGGYSFPLDPGNSKVTRNAWEAFTESQLLRHARVHTSTFRPDLKPGEIIEINGRGLVNIYYPVPTPRIKGDPTPFLIHLEKVFPDPRDRVIMLSYMAATLRYLGVKFQWCPLLQGMQGNGKTFFTRVLAFGIGDRYTHFPNAKQLGSNFNDWMYARCFIGVEDIYDGKREIAEALKPMVTNNRLEIEPKGGVKTTRDICCNFIINTNHRDGLRKQRGDRRFAPFFTAQQRLEDLKRDKMDGDYFYNLYHWAYRENGMAIICEFLDNFQIPDEFNPATHCQRAPFTTSTDTAIEHSMTPLEQEIKESIEQDVIGFKKGWISSFALDSLLAKMHLQARIPHNKRREILQDMGYDWHPGLKEGRVNNIIMPDGGKPRLFVTTDHPSKDLTSPAEIAARYTEDQK